MIRGILFLILTLTTSCSAKSTETKKIVTKSDGIAHELLVKFVESTPKDEINKIITNCGGTIIKHIEGINVFHIKVSTSTAGGMRCFQKNSAVKYAEPNRVVKIYK